MVRCEMIPTEKGDQSSRERDGKAMNRAAALKEKHLRRPLEFLLDSFYCRHFNILFCAEDSFSLFPAWKTQNAHLVSTWNHRNSRLTSELEVI